MIAAAARAFALAALVALAPGFSRAEPALDEIDRARAMLDDAEDALRRAGSKGTRRAALGKAVAAHEAALAALRDGLRRLAVEDRALVDALGAERERMAQVIGALQSLGQAPRSAMLVHPEGSVAAARTAMIMADLTPRLKAEMAGIARRIDALRSLRLRQEIARAEARGTLAALQALRAESSRTSRRDRPARSAEATRRALLQQASEAEARARDLDQLAATLRASFGAEPGPAFESLRGRLPLPVAGRQVGSFGGVDPWGRTGQGISLRAPAWAEVRAPAAGTIRYAGPLIDYGTVVILEPEADWLFVLAGLAATDRRVGETVLAGERLGDLGGPLPSSEEFLLEASGPVPKIDTTDLYVELRQSGTAVDPAPWFENTRE
ncbi:peptidoglycan DD-metalloendopeptidase family protein [Paralimibaculum aggregatum]|uniref:Peptidoglycan DD-metalloendopeptidase family protein n=1 Tax=Paralimibaculum aggregatum TaxID=3036245 RepID=A0ABQ6LJU2_9RHOB|nr:peptidoglycan DD-metalloendopeptidase family protein [Limibaculum sp. NKW23]GMG82490.1 peptidoglycan DD-metalloendopeptidase family protein [Limibaculum sp. NKW23]